MGLFLGSLRFNCKFYWILHTPYRFKLHVFEQTIKTIALSNKVVVLSKNMALLYQNISETHIRIDFCNETEVLIINA